MHPGASLTAAEPAGRRPARGRRGKLPRVGVLNGPNLNLLGTREPRLYGKLSYAALVRRIEARAADLGVAVDVFQSNHEGDLIDRLHAWSREGDVIGVVVNPGGLAHTSVSLRDAVAALPFPAVEVHLTNIAAREAFRHRSLVSAVARGVVSGLGPDGYLAALAYLCGRRGVGGGAAGRGRL